VQSTRSCFGRLKSVVERSEGQMIGYCSEHVGYPVARWRWERACERFSASVGDAYVHEKHLTLSYHGETKRSKWNHIFKCSVRLRSSMQARISLKTRWRQLNSLTDGLGNLFPFPKWASTIADTPGLSLG
jgi:hypothetical protein